MIDILIAGLIGFFLGSFTTFGILALLAIARYGEDGHGED